MPNLRGGLQKGLQRPPRSENLMPPRLKINFIPYANTSESLVLLSKIAQFRVFLSLTTILHHTVRLPDSLTGYNIVSYPILFTFPAAPIVIS